MSENLIVNGQPEGTFRKFWGGIDTGLSLQITLGGISAVLNQAQVHDLISVLVAHWIVRDEPLSEREGKP